MGELLLIRRWEKINKTNFYWIMLLMHTVWEYLNILPLDIVQKSLWISTHFDTQRLDIVQNSLWISSHFDFFFFLSDFGDIFKKVQHVKTS